MKRRLDSGDEHVKGHELIWPRAVVGVVRVGELGNCAASWTAGRILREKGADIRGWQMKKGVATGVYGKAGDDCWQPENG